MEETKGMKTARLGRQGPVVSALGLGCMGMSAVYGAADEAESIATVQMAIDHGITLIDTGDFYGMGHNEMLLRRALAGRRAQVQISVKFGAMRTPSGAWSGYDARPAAVNNFLAYTLQRLGTDYVDIYRPARLDPAVPIEETVGAIGRLVEQGYVRHIGLSEISGETARRAAAVHAISDVQLEYSMVSRGIEPKILPTLRELGIGVTAYGVLSRGLLSGSRPKDQGDIRNRMPRFAAGNYEENRKFIAALQKLAAERGVTSAQLAIAWVRSRGEDIVPLVGARTRPQLQEALAGFELKLSEEERQRMEAAVPAAEVRGQRYDEPQLKMLDSERG
jgi:aryl-alcohol dehydrogenase-like predicted oxidoreductase